MRNIGIITFHNAHNYGACLQVYALQNYLISRGHNVEIIDYDSNITKHYNLVIPKFRKNLIILVKQLLNNVKYYKSRKQNADNFIDFSKNHLRISTKHYKNIQMLKKDVMNYDTLICGSDQIWNTSLIGKCDEAYLLNFGPSSIRRLSYAASIGSDTIPLRYIPKFKKNLSKFNAISVRENEMVAQIKEISSKEISVVVDPVFLINKDVWIRNFHLKKYVEQPYIFVYSVTVNPFLDECANKLVKLTGLKIVCFNNDNLDSNVAELISSCSPEKFVNYIYNAEYVISNSFHATAFSIIFEKKFFVVPHATLNSRIMNLLSISGLEERQITKDEGIHKENSDKKINYTAVRLRIETEIRHSKDFLDSNLE